jgi:uncharacterized protein (TIGR02231 family)
MTAVSRIDSVVVYTDRALVTRIIKVTLNRPVDVEIPDLPGSLDDQSVRAKAQDLQIGEIQVRTGYKKKPGQEEKAIEQRIKKLKNEDRALADELNVMQEKQKFLGSITITAPEMISKELFIGKVAPDAWRDGLEFMSQQMLNVKTRSAEIERQRTTIQEKLVALERELQDITSLQQNRKTVVFDAHPKHEKEYTIEISYIMYGAGWRTYYELRADVQTTKVSIAYYGKVHQRTGEDWDDVQLSLSTAQPALGGAAPEPYPWYIDLYVPRPMKKARMVAAKSAAAPEEAETGMMDEQLEEVVPPVDTGIAIRYPLPDRFTIKTGEPEKKVVIGSYELESEFEYFIIPRVTEQAFSIGTFKNTTGCLFLAGDANTYVGDDYTGQIPVDTIAPEEEVTVSFGIDERIKVERKTKKKKVTKGGLVKKATKHEYEYENVITNLHKKDVLCKIVDQIPIAQSPDIKVSGVHVTPKPTEEEKDRGIFKWEIPIAEGQEFCIALGFTVDVPYGARVDGLG